MVKVENLSFSYKQGLSIFSDFNWEVGPEERWSVIGPSGCGKTTLLYLLAGLRIPEAGNIQVTTGRSSHKVITGLILQDYGLLPWATAFQNVALGLRIQKFDSKLIPELTHRWLSDLGIDSVASHYPSELSGGQRQRVAIARTLVLQPSLLLMDEPFASLDTLTREDLLDLTLGLWHKQPSSMVLVTHNIEEAVYWGSHILVLNKAPNHQTRVVENQESGNLGYRESLSFGTLCRQIKAMIEQAANSPAGGRA